MEPNEQDGAGVTGVNPAGSQGLNGMTSHGRPPWIDSVDGQIHIKKTDTIGLEYQVAGHSRVGLLTHKLGHVLKPVQKEPLGSREIDMYRTIAKHSNHKQELMQNGQSCDQESNQDECMRLLQQVTPKFYGVAVIEEDRVERTLSEPEASAQYLVLDNIVQGFQSPSIVDIKIGEQTWSPDATDVKIQHEKSKYVGTKSQLGLSVTGMHYYDLSSGTSVRCEEGFGKRLDAESIYTALKQFLNSSAGIDKVVAQLILDKLRPIQEFFGVQRLYNFYSSSVLISYDAKYVAYCFKPNHALNPSAEPGLQLLRRTQDRWLRVLMIDFAHVHPNSAGKDLDLNYIHGLDNLVTILKNIINDEASPEPPVPAPASESA